MSSPIPIHDGRDNLGRFTKTYRPKNKRPDDAKPRAGRTYRLSAETIEKMIHLRPAFGTLAAVIEAGVSALPELPEEPRSGEPL
jgi:hypothetical protein